MGLASSPAADLLRSLAARLRPGGFKTRSFGRRHGPRHDNHSIYTIDWSGKPQFDQRLRAAAVKRFILCVGCWMRKAPQRALMEIKYCHEAVG